MIWSTQSLDLNSIKNLWYIFKVKFHERYTNLHYSLSKSQKTINKYNNILMQVWDKLDFTVVNNLIRFMPGRVQTIIAAKGNAIRY